MKTAIMNIIHTVWTFIKAHTVASIVAGAVVVTAAVATPVTIHLINEHNHPVFEPHTESNTPELDEKYAQQAEKEEEAGLPTQEEQEAAQKAEEEAKAKAEAEAAAKAEAEALAKAEAEAKAKAEAEAQPQKEEPAKQEAESKPNNTETTSNDQNKETTPNNQSTVVQTANTSTGISWDGKSPIVYTYEDGTTGTTPQDGANYEVIPGVYGTYTAPPEIDEKPYDGICPYCSKKEGDGASGTCLRWDLTTNDHNCPHCGVVVPPSTCHSCG